MTTVLITGAAGFIGSHFTRYWVAGHPEDRVVALDALTYAGTPASPSTT
ncbi:NAD-dependent epimerase/dehydratase family protein [Saccharothrix syringae]